jgi:hypothetical protein
MRFGTGGVAADAVSGATGFASAMLADMVGLRVIDDLSLPPNFGNNGFRILTTNADAVKLNVAQTVSLRYMAMIFFLSYAH